MADISKFELNGTTYNIKASGSIPTSAKGTANGVAELDANGKVPSSQLPSYVDDVLEYSAKSSFPATGESGKIYVDTTTNNTYRWSGSAYVEISKSLALGETSSTAYRGDRGKAAYDHSQLTSGNPHNVTKTDVGLGNVGNFKAVSTVASQGLSNTEKSNARANIGAGTGNGTYSKPSGGIPKSDLATAVQTSLNQVATNKTNILYTIDTGAKNLLKLIRSDASSEATISDDGSITVNHSAVSGNYTIHFFTGGGAGYKPLPTEWIGKYFSGVTTYVEGAAFLMEFSDNGINWSDEIGVNSPTTKAKIPNTHPYYRFGLKFNSKVAVTNYVLKPMIADEIVYNTVGAGQPPAKPNYDLTYLEAEDRAALAEVVDSGAKNLLPLDLSLMKSRNTGGTWTNNVYKIGKVDITVNSDGTIKLNGTSNNQFEFYICTRVSDTFKLPVGTYMFYNSLSASTGGNWDIAINRTVSGAGIRYGSDTGNGLLFTVTDSSATTGVWIACNVAGTVFNNVTIKPMICTKAAFGVSNKFVPYRPNYDAVSKAAMSAAFTHQTIQNADLNSINKNYYGLYQSATNMPSGTSGFAFVRTTWFDSQAAMQELTLLAATSNSYVRVKYGNAWTAWKQVTNA